MKITLFIPFIILLAGCKSATTGSNLQVDSHEVLRLVNNARSKGCHCGDKYMPPIAALKWNNALQKAAQMQSNNMRRGSYFSHVSPDGKSTPAVRLKQAGYTWSATAENIAMGQMSVQEVVARWLKSPSHCINIMNATYTEMGVAASGNYWTQVFGKPKATKTTK